MTLPRITLMQADEVASPFHRDGWVYEEKYDGWRMAAYKDGTAVRLVSRAGNGHTVASQSSRQRSEPYLPRRAFSMGKCRSSTAAHLALRVVQGAARDGAAMPPIYMVFECLLCRWPGLAAPAAPRARD